jgi:hypothetical protein
MEVVLGVKRQRMNTLPFWREFTLKYSHLSEGFLVQPFHTLIHARLSLRMYVLQL